MAKRRRRAASPDDTPAGVTAARGIESKVEEFAEDLGRILGTAQAKASAWLNQRKSVAEQLTTIRNTADQMLRQLGDESGLLWRRAKGGVRKGRITSTGDPGGAGPKKKRVMSAKARAAISRAQKLRWARQKGQRDK
jgi:hypothetical protein